MTDDPMWDDFAQAVVSLDLAEGPAVLRPGESGCVGLFPFDRPVYIITAYNPDGVAPLEEDNATRHLALGRTLRGRATVPSIGSASDGTFAEPGYAVLDTTLEEAITVGRRFGQRAIYVWSADALTILGIDEPVELHLGWALERENHSHLGHMS